MSSHDAGKWLDSLGTLIRLSLRGAAAGQAPPAEARARLLARALADQRRREQAISLVLAARGRLQPPPLSPMAHLVYATPRNLSFFGLPLY